MRLKRLAAVTMSMVMALTITAYANDADAVAVYQEMEAKSNAMSDMDAYFDFDMDMSDGTNQMGMRLEMNVKANNLKVPEQMKMNTYMRMTVTNAGTSDSSEGPGAGSVTMDLTGNAITANVYYADGMYYTDMLGQKVKMPVPLNEMVESIQQLTGTMGSSLDYINNLTLRTEGENRILNFTMDASRMNNLLGQFMGSMESLMSGAGVSYRDITCEYVVDPNGNCTKSKMKMTIDVTVEGSTVSVILDGDIGYANPGQPVTITVPNLAEYTLAE